MDLDADGYCVLPSILSLRQVRDALEAWETVCQANANDPAILQDADGAISGVRNLLRMWPGVVELARQPRLQDRLAKLLGPHFGVVRALFFDKPPGRGWALPWHKDYNIAVREHGKIGPFNKPTKKASVPHVEAPERLLREMLTVRIHLDDMTDDNGPLRIIPGSHRNDGLESRPPISIHCRACDVLLMRPLLTHSSANCDPACSRHRRIIHIECAPHPELSEGYHWHDFIRVVG